MNLITRGLGFFQKLITQGFGAFIEIVYPDDTKEVRRVESGGGFVDDIFDTIDKAIIKTNAMKVNPNFRLRINVTFFEKPTIEVESRLLKYEYENRNIEIKVTIL